MPCVSMAWRRTGGAREWAPYLSCGMGLAMESSVVRLCRDGWLWSSRDAPPRRKKGDGRLRVRSAAHPS